MSKKYKLTQDTVLYCGKTLYRIRALKDFGNVKAGELGGYVETESNLSHDGDCWVYDNAYVLGNARVTDNARVYDNAEVYDKAYVYDDVIVSDNALVTGNARVYDNARISGNAHVSGCAYIYGNAHISEKTHLRNFDEISKTEHCFNISGFKHPITVTPTSINIGCESYDFDMLDREIENEFFFQDDFNRMKIMIEMALEQVLENI
jgi:predicted acyltransferase (DUF342 family)